MTTYFATLFCILLQVLPFHELSLKTSDNTVISFQEYVGKKVLIVNIASNSADSAQFRKLEELRDQFSDKLIVIAIPSDEFGNEPLSNEQMIDSIQQRYDTHFIIGEKMILKGSEASPIYQWLSKKSQNGLTDTKVETDFCKYLINENGQLLGVFSNKVLPTDDAIKSFLK